ncbi:MAG: formate dehydrogenase accessory sulfurtransferase FdhD [Gammaproteobacteria bacterium]|nr:formate dehydrogenase accessory sulfurtransferase FdhD [Gammaproteobacteria bacterium]
MSVGGLAALKSAKSVRIERFGADGGTCDDVVATEEPLEIRLSWTHPDGRREQKSISITMRTPGNDEELAAGFLLTEGIIAGPAELEAVGPCGPPAANGLINVVRVDLARDVEVDLARLERHFYTSSSCGVCGKASLEAVAVQGRYDLHDNTLRMSAEGLGALPDRLEALQSVFERTGGLHASGLFDDAGQVRVSREDVGRHNALDKLIGQALLKDELPMSDYGVVVSGRASFELMQKAMMAGIPMVAAVGAPSSLAVEFAEEFGMTLVGFLTADRFNVYSRPDRIA